MQKKYYQVLCGAFVFGLLSFSMAGCGKRAAVEENSFSYEDSSLSSPVSTTITGIVQRIENTDISLSIMENVGNGQAPPEKPGNSNAEENQAPGKEASENGQTPPEKPGNSNAENAQASPEGEQMPQENSGILSLTDASLLKKADGSSASLNDITEGLCLSITFDENGRITQIQISEKIQGEEGQDFGPGGMPPGEADSGVESYKAVNTYNEDTSISDKSLSSSGQDENTVLVNEGGAVKLSDVTIKRTSSDSTGGDKSSFYGVGAALLSTDGAAYIRDSIIQTDAAGGAGLFAYDKGTVYAADCVITTQKDTSGGVHAAGGGAVYGWGLDITTNGASSAAIRSDRGGGTMVLDGGSYVSNGSGSPAVYCTADIAVSNASLTANGSEAVCIEGLNSLHLFNCDVKGNMPDDKQNDTTWTMIVYQSMSGDSEIGNSRLQMSGGSLISENGGLIYTTNTESDILLKDVDITCAEDSEFFLRCTGNQNQRGWGKSGENGARCSFTADGQYMPGDIIWDSISELDFYMTGESVLSGAVLNDESCAGSGGDGYCNLYIGQDAVWIVDGDSVLSGLYCAGTIKDSQGNSVTIKNQDGAVLVQGTSDIEITVSHYEANADLSGASQAALEEDYLKERPSELLP